MPKAKDYLTRALHQSQEATFELLARAVQEMPKACSLLLPLTWCQKAPCKLSKEEGNQQTYPATMPINQNNDQQGAVTL